ncbi:MAG TPA: ssl1498 family light-harvesting-like protein [Waterburya sp.]|jgi:hypothetical protein
MRYTDNQGKTLSLNECMTADSFLMQAEVYISEPLEMHFNPQGELQAGKRTNKTVAHRSDGSELIPAEVQANTRNDENKLLNEPLVAGYTVDDEGITNNYAIEPVMYSAEYPSPKQQQHYALQGAVAILFVALTLWSASAVS